MVFISVAFAAGKIARAFEHPAIGSGQTREIDFVLLGLAGEGTPGEIGEAFVSPGDRTPDFHVKVVGDFEGHGFHRNTGGNIRRFRAVSFRREDDSPSLPS
jgi:hypothetical protein